MQLRAQETNWGVDFSEAIMDRHPGTINDLTGKGWEYSNSIVLYGMIKIYEYTHNPEYLNYVKKYVDVFVSSNGSINFDTNANNLDHLHPGLLLLFLYEETGIEKYKIAADKVRAEFNLQPRTASGGYWHKQRYPNQMWADGIYMAEPFLMQYGAMFDDLAYASNEATKQTTLLASHAYDESLHLIYHGWDESKSASWVNSEGRSPCVWSRGMGWYCMALVDMLDYLPETHEKYTEMLTLIQNLAIGIKENQDATTGLWYQVVDKGSLSSNWIETSGSMMFIYMLKKAMDKGYIDDSYATVVEKGWTGMQSKITLDSYKRPVINGFVGGMGIKDNYATYVAQSTVSTPTSSHPHGYCAILSLASVMEWPKDKIYELTLTTTGSGTVETPSEETIYMPGEYVKLIAHAEGDATFTGWSGAASGSDTIVYVEMSEAKSVTANFTTKTTAHEVHTTEFSIFPNPATETLNVEIDFAQEQAYQILSIDGKVLKSDILNSSSAQIDISALQSGAYFLKIGTTSKRFVKQ